MRWQYQFRHTLSKNGLWGVGTVLIRESGCVDRYETRVQVGDGGWVLVPGNVFDAGIAEEQHWWVVRYVTVLLGDYAVPPVKFCEYRGRSSTTYDCPRAIDVEALP